MKRRDLLKAIGAIPFVGSFLSTLAPGTAEGDGDDKVKTKEPKPYVIYKAGEIIESGDLEEEIITQIKDMESFGLNPVSIHTNQNGYDYFIKRESVSVYGGLAKFHYIGRYGPVALPIANDKFWGEPRAIVFSIQDEMDRIRQRRNL